MANKADTTPAWLREDLVSDNVPARVTNATDVENGKNNSSTGNESKTVAGITIPKSEDVPRMILYTRVINLFLSVGMLVASLLSLLTTTDATTGVLACYTVAFGCLLCCYETHLKQVSKLIAKNFGFLYSAKSRCIFMLFIGTIMFSFSLFGKLIGLLMLANACFNGFLLCMYPEFDDLQRKDAQAEIQDFLTANPAYAAKAVSLGVSAGASVAAHNPELAKQGMTAFMQGAAKGNGNSGNYSPVNSNQV